MNTVFTNNINRLKNLVLLQPKSNDFVFVQILQRRKDNPDLELGVKRLKSYSFYSWEELESQADRIQEICDLNNARAYIRLNTQNSVDVSLRCIEEIAKNLRNGNPDNNRNVWDSVSGQGGSKRWWVLDIDQEHLNFMWHENGMHLLPFLKKDLEEHYFERFKPDGIPTREWSREVFPIVTNATRTGIHLICAPFDTRILDGYNKCFSANQLPTIQIQKDANTVLYIGNPENLIQYKTKK